MENDGRNLQAGSNGEQGLNPSAFPAETDARFTLMLAAAVMLVFWASLSLTSFFGLDPLVTPVTYASLEDLPGMADFEGTLVEYRARLLVDLGLNLTWLGLPVGLILLLFVVAAVLYRTHPRRIRRQFPVKPFGPETHPKLLRLVGVLMDRAGLEEKPQMELGKSLRLTEGQAYGFEEKQILRLDGGLQRAVNKQPHRIEAVVLHELGHIANRDVGHYQFSIAIWIALVALVFVPAVIGFGYRVVEALVEGGNVWLALLLLAQLPLALALVAAIQAGLARTREYYADWQAVLWGGRASLMRVFEAAPEEARPPWKRPWLRHPPAMERLAVLRQPERLFRLGWEMPLVVGIVLAFVTAGLFVAALVLAGLLHDVTAIGSVTAMLADSSGRLLPTGLLNFGWIVVMGLLLLPIATIAYLVAGSLGLQVQRAAVADLWAGTVGRAGYLSLWRPAVLLTLGLEIGFALTPIPLFSPLLGLVGLYEFNPLLLLAVEVATIALTWLCLCYARFAAQRVLGTHTGSAPPRGKWRLLTLAFVFLLTAWYVPLLLARQGLLTGRSQVPPGLTFAGLGAGAVGLCLALFAATWLLTRGRWGGKSLRCPDCGQQAGRSYATGQHCSHCGQELALWPLASET